MMFSLSFVGGSRSAEGGPNPLADLDRGGPCLLADLDNDTSKALNALLVSLQC